MDPTISWFISIASVCSLAWAGGYYLGRRSAATARATLIAGLACMGIWTWLTYHPAVAVVLIPLPILSSIEGVGSVPFFMLLLGLAWSKARIPRQKRLITWAIMFGAVFFLNGGLWMLQSTPEAGFAGTIDDSTVMQSQDYSCVAAASAQTLNLLGIKTSERQMALLTQTRPGTGSTTLRAMYGLNQRLKHSDYEVELLEISLDDLAQLPFPLMTPLQYEPTRRHMVTIKDVSKDVLYVLDPVDGEVMISWETMDKVFTGEVLVFIQR